MHGVTALRKQRKSAGSFIGMPVISLRTRVMNANFDLRRTFMAIAPENLRMVEVARKTGERMLFAD